MMRTGVIQLHRWVGLTAGLLAVFLAVTGGWIVLRPLLDPVTYPELMVIPSCAKPLPVDRLAAAARAVHPKGKLTYVYLYGSGTASTMVRFSDADQVYVDTCSGEVLGHQARYGGLYGTMEALHRFRFMSGGAGLTIIGWGALLFAIVMVAGGLFLWWPRRTSAWKGALKFNPRLKGRALALNVHTTIGAYAAVVLFVVAVTAVPLSLGWAKAAMFGVTGTTDMTEDARLPVAAPKSIETKSGTTISMQTAWEKARGVIGGPLLWASVHYPAKGEAIEIGIVEQGAPHADARSYVFVDSRTANIVELRSWATLNAGSKLYYWLLALHTGHFGGVFVQCLMLAGMIGVVALGYTGVETFLRRTFRRPRTSTTRRLSRLER
jgi:uncharacterized iron-regulated membrane protein